MGCIQDLLWPLQSGMAAQACTTLAQADPRVTLFSEQNEDRQMKCLFSDSRVLKTAIIHSPSGHVTQA